MTLERKEENRMPIQVWLREPKVCITLQGEKILKKEWRLRRLGLFRRRLCVAAEDGNAVMFHADNVLLVQTVTKEDLKKIREVAEKEGGQRRVQPVAVVPTGRR